MSNPSRRKGTAHETDVVDYLRANGWPHAERRAQHGTNDQGDIAGIPWLVIEAKNCKEHKTARWIAEAAREAEHASADAGIVWIRARGTSDRGRDIVAMRADQFLRLARMVEGWPPGTEAENL